ncbi:HMP-PP phosphatase [Paraburkholderia domus]|jgi:Predicted hydrolases of the HAD superfamily|uniref:HMP-PP phosphatase n=1 Tax=Paraburkholderia domus TaxID=2793075 RepID=A0A9N8MQ84_9BURK|nr:HAD family hydrolase [Paraburkholderia domus]MBK5051503.1 HAD family hydrolase [Burkholderia sp. R-70006]MBK5063644.1 HAD family hydrolase [Burkholderia sp. R-70199]MBK5089665.1 HAD family hydrolase [Burkholderia sp. R-69927]MBK5122870.1 HAD family hydrolase [Burkholderia sp. R-69980]MBK5165262.1 HAD family hydrolase [Burkholderia sp. R-70211]MBK5182718.1 HAD family hydrolase [Burkholderia sp. R-69749]MCI0148972.1 HAD hydrolase family protein [Paraburkholderia sediminicola]
MSSQLLRSRESSEPWRAVVIDLDGTLLDDRGMISDYSIKILELLHRRNMMIIIATGRLDEDARRVLQKLSFAPTVLSCNGALVKTGPQHSPVFEQTLAPALSGKILRFTRRLPLHVTLFSRAGWHSLTPNPDFTGYIASSGLTCHYHDERTLHNIAPFKILLHGDANTTDTALVALRERFGAVSESSKSSPKTIDIVSRNLSKMTAAKRFLASQHISLTQTIALGDAMNDMELLRSVGHGVLMGNAMTELQCHLPNLPQALPNYRDGVAHYLEQLLALSKELAIAD